MMDNRKTQKLQRVYNANENKAFIQHVIEYLYYMLLKLYLLKILIIIFNNKNYKEIRFSISLFILCNNINKLITTLVITYYITTTSIHKIDNFKE